MTGAYVPEGFDAVIRQEDTDYGMENVEIYHAVTAFQNYCKVGEDIEKGQKIVAAGTKLTPLHIGLLASVGCGKVEVVSPVTVAILSTGTELCAVGETLAPGKIYNNIAYILQAAIRREGFRVVSAEICKDDEELLEEKLKELAQRAEIVITTGGVSVGMRDLIPAVVERLGAQVIFRRARIQPGTPTMASRYQDTLMLHLSGNPYAALANFELYFWPLAAKMMSDEGYVPPVTTAVLDCEYNKINKSRRLVRAYAKNGRVTLPSGVHASSVIHNLTECNCFIDLEAGQSVKPGDIVTIRYFKE
jgi:molybdopterin molybdotransferase